MCSFYLDYFACIGECSADAEIKVFPVENPELITVLLVKPGMGQNITTHVSPTARNFFLVLISAFLFHSPLGVFQSHSSPFSFALVLANAVSCVGPWNEIGHPAHSHKQFRQVCMMSACRMGTSTCVVVECMNG